MLPVDWHVHMMQPATMNLSFMEIFHWCHSLKEYDSSSNSGRPPGHRHKLLAGGEKIYSFSIQDSNLFKK